MSDPILPTAEQMQRRLQELLRASFSSPAPSPSEPVAPVQNPETVPQSILDFHLTPKDIKKHLDRFVIRQDEAKKVLGIAVCDHYNNARVMASREADGPPLEYSKQNVLLAGPTGVGKTYLVKHVAELVGVPFVKADATKFSETGYVGGDVDDLVRDLIRRAGGDVKRASHGIIYLDEVDKLAGSSEGGGRDVSGRGVQTNLLKLMEDGDVPVLSPNDVTGQLQSAMSAARGNTPGMPDTISTRHILFIASGAFVGIDQVIRDRLVAPQLSLEKTHAQISTSDFIRFGLEPEFVGRLPVRVACHALDENDLFQVLSRSESSLIHQYERSFAAYGIALRFQPDALRRLASLARDEKTGARGLMTVLERTFRDLKFRLPSTKIRSLTITPETVENPTAALAKLLKK
jgi:endopeptidase Clp ATP-binding regulatory subunit ClpX